MGGSNKPKMPEGQGVKAMEENEREIREAVFNERMSIVNMIEDDFADSMSEDLAILKTMLTDRMFDLGVELGLFKNVRIICAASLAADREDLRKRLNVIFGKKGEQ